jgi:hypothetical protein
MADPQITPISVPAVPALPAAPAPTPASTPAPVVTEAAPPSPSVVAPSAAVTPPPADTSSAATEPAKTQAQQPTSLLSEPPRADAVKEPAKAEGEKPTETKPAEAPPAPVFEAFKLPEGVELNQGDVGKFTEMLGKFEVETKADHTKLQAFGQQLMNTYVAEMQRMQEAGQQHWTRMRDEWKSNFINDPDIGKSNQAQTLSRCRSMIDQYGGTAEQRAELRQIFAITGAGDHPSVIRFMNNVGKVLSEPTVTATGRQVAPAATSSRSARRYANTLGPNGAN